MTMRAFLSNAAQVLGLVLLVVGVGDWSRPAALMVAGGGLMFIGDRWRP